MKYNLKIAWLYPELMSTYGDRGNVICLQKRCQWRGINADIIPISLNLNNQKLGFTDLIFMGGAQDRQQSIVGEDFINKKRPILKKLIEKGTPGLFVCAAYQALGKYYKPYVGDPIPGLGIFDLYTQHPGDQAKRLIGNISAEIIRSKLTNFLGSQLSIVGFENHGGRTYLGKGVKPFARIVHGFGNNGEDGFEGAVYKNCIGSYLHGPILPKNPHLADYLIKQAIDIKYRLDISLEPLDDVLELKAHQAIIQRF
ncbi:cobalamin biosynthesis protein CobQ [Candidatus Gottesmanbacteria bacterium]|nr:cobalamin biosynthesis protein CobQ [Candidatus Gottesmanbacteria bacterium]